MNKDFLNAIFLGVLGIAFLTFLIIQIPKAIDIETNMRQEQAAEHLYHMERVDYNANK